MNGIKRKLRGLALTALALGAFMSPAQAAPVVSVSPATQTIGLGGPATVDIIVSGLTQALGGFQFVLGFNNTFLSANAFVANPDNLMGTSPLDLSLGFSGGTLDVFYVADAGADEAALALAQGDGFRLATVSFQGAAIGLSPLSLTGVVLSNFTGGADIDGVTTQNGEICVGTREDCAAAPVPEPASMLLVATALGMLAMRRRKAV